VSPYAPDVRLSLAGVGVWGTHAQEHYCKAFVLYLLPVGLCFGYDAIQVGYKRTFVRPLPACKSEGRHGVGSTARLGGG